MSFELIVHPVVMSFELIVHPVVIMSFNLFYSTQGALHTDSYLLYIFDIPPYRSVFSLTDPDPETP
jgi:hypothetical protein